MLENLCQFVEKIYELISAKGTFFPGPNDMLPANGIYFFFEKGQKIRIKNREYDRIVRIGINEKPNNFIRRINDHYKGNIKASVFRENIGWSILERTGFKPKIVYKTKKNYKMQNSGGLLEKVISKYFSENLTFKAFSIDYAKLKEYEKILTGAFSIYYQYKIWRRELDIKNWLGSYSYSQGDRIRRSALWNSQSVILVKTFNPLMFEAKFDIRNFFCVKFENVLSDLDRGIV